MTKRFFAVIILFFVGFLLVYFGYRRITNNSNKEKNKGVQNLVDKIKKHYGEYVTTVSETTLYTEKDNKYKKIGKVNKDVHLKLKNMKINNSTKYFEIENIDCFVKYDSVKPIKKESINVNYKKYIPYNSNIKFENATFYDIDNNYVYEIKKAFDLKIIYKDDEKYGVDYGDKLLFINKSDIKEEYENNNNMSNKDKIRTLTYHFIYDPKSDECNQEICFTLEKFEEQLKYITENDYLTLKMQDLEWYLDGKINIPEKSVVLTVDDGTLFNRKAIDLLEKYKVNMTMFVITSIADNFDQYKSDYLDLESHTDNMHNQYECPGYGMQGGGILCLPEDKVLEDLKKSQEKLGGSKYFAYPFFDVNDRAIKLLKEAGFKLAFIGQYDSEGYSYPNKTDHYKIRRMTIFNSTTEKEFAEYLS